MNTVLKTENLEDFWMPFSSNHDYKQRPRMVVGAKDAYFYDAEGREIVDGSSGLFCVPLGHGRESIAEAVKEQILKLDYSSPFQMGQPAGFQAAEILSELLPEGVDRVFFTNSGSESVDTAMKMAVAYHRQRGEGQRRVFVSRRRAYHGVNLGGTTLSGMMRNRNVYGGITGEVHFLPDTLTGKERFKPGQPEQGAELADELLAIATTLGPENIAAVFIEPIAGSTGVLVPPVGYLERIREHCDRHGILLVFDEVITGFYRLGKAFASQTFNVRPDIMTMAKALTNGNIPMGAVACGDSIYQTLVNERAGESIEFFHGYTYSAHPSACAAMLESMRLMKEENAEAKVAELIPYFQKKIHALEKHDRVKDIRSFGLMAGVELETEGEIGRAGMRATKATFREGLHVKFTGDVGIVAPQFICETSHVDEICDKLSAVLES